MENHYQMGFCALLLNLCALIILASATRPPRWESTYIVSGTLYIPYAEIEEPFYGWYDRDSNRSRVDYYGGMVKTYQLANEGDYGVALKLAPVTMHGVLNRMTCFKLNGSLENGIGIQPLLPDAKDFELISTEPFLGFTCDKFRLKEKLGQKENTYTMWVRYKKSPKYNATRMPIPVRYEMRGYNKLLGSHYDHYYLDYDSYEIDPIPNEVFKISQEMTCGNFPGPGMYATFNPMQEFVHPAVQDHIDYQFNEFKNKHNVQYHSQKEHEHRLNIFRQNVRFIHSMNRANLTFKLAVNHLADKTDEQLRVRRGYRPSNKGNNAKPFPYATSQYRDELPDQHDWRIYGAVTPVKDQSVCGSCWSFGTIGHIEGAYFLHNGGNLVRLSQQALIDCSWQYGNNGCDGGEDFRVYEWMLEMGGVPTEEEYGAYLGQDGFCHVVNTSLVAPITGYVKVTPNDTLAFKVALFKHGPLSVAIDASPKTFSYYSHGIYYEPKCKNGPDQLDHAVLAVGYGSINGADYWLVKNSWSTYWGNDGYILMSTRNNNCGVMTMPTYVVM